MPTSPRETRRSGRRSAPSASTSASKSPDSDQPPKQKDSSARSAPASSMANGRNKRLKQEDLEDPDDDRKTNQAPSVGSSGSTSQGIPNGKGKRRSKDSKQVAEEQVDHSSDPAPDDELGAGDEEEQGITRCVCGSSEDDPDAGEFMIQCEGCKVWQHGPCMGFITEDQVQDDDYYCEQCKPEAHTDLLKRLSNKKNRREAMAARISRSRSPSQHKQPSKRRNTMNSRLDDTLKEIMEATAAEAAGKDPNATVGEEPAAGNDAEDDGESQANNKKKRKRTEDEVPPKKRTRSASTASDRQGSANPRDETPGSVSAKPASQAPASAKGGRNKRGGRKAVVTEPSAPATDGDDVATPSVPPTASAKRGGPGSRKGVNAKRPPLSHAVSNNSTGANQEHTTSRARNPAGINQHTSSANAEARAYRNSHAYAVSQQPLLTSWGLPDYLAHLEHILPTDTPQPLEIRAGASNNTTGQSGDNSEHTMERGVKVKWPSKRMSVGDMNKRVRALVEWVGREQANALDRERRREALEKDLLRVTAGSLTTQGDGDIVMAIADGEANANEGEASANAPPSLPKPVDKEATSSTMRLMEELMEELINFQEKFGRR